MLRIVIPRSFHLTDDFCCGLGEARRSLLDSFNAASVISMTNLATRPGHFIPLAVQVFDPSGADVVAEFKEAQSFEEWAKDIKASVEGSFRFCIRGAYPSLAPPRRAVIAARPEKLS